MDVVYIATHAYEDGAEGGCVTNVGEVFQKFAVLFSCLHKRYDMVSISAELDLHYCDVGFAIGAIVPEGDVWFGAL